MKMINEYPNKQPQEDELEKSLFLVFWFKELT